MRYFIIYKPYSMLSQFSREGEHKTLADLEFKFPKDVYPVGRLDSDSEGLLLLTDDKSLNHRLLEPKFAHERSYWVQVEGIVTEKALQLLRDGVTISVNGKQHRTLPAKVKKLGQISVPERIPPIRFRKNVPDEWIELKLTEGKNRQVRKMTAAVGFPTLRLIRSSIEKIALDGMLPGDVIELDAAMVYKLLNIKPR